MYCILLNLLYFRPYGAKIKGVYWSIYSLDIAVGINNTLDTFINIIQCIYKNITYFTIQYIPEITAKQPKKYFKLQPKQG